MWMARPAGAVSHRLHLSCCHSSRTSTPRQDGILLQSTWMRAIQPTPPSTMPNPTVVEILVRAQTQTTIQPRLQTTTVVDPPPFGLGPRRRLRLGSSLLLQATEGMTVGSWIQTAPRWTSIPNAGATIFPKGTESKCLASPLFRILIH